LIYIPISIDSVPCLYYSPKSGTAKKLILYFHGINKDLGATRIHREIIALGEALNSNVIVVEYPGFGLNFKQGSTSSN
jgi:acetyl esterase/lipase